MRLLSGFIFSFAFAILMVIGFTYISNMYRVKSTISYSKDGNAIVKSGLYKDNFLVKEIQDSCFFNEVDSVKAQHKRILKMLKNTKQNKIVPMSSSNSIDLWLDANFNKNDSIIISINGYRQGKFFDDTTLTFIK